jgi:hypothetical protein
MTLDFASRELAMWAIGEIILLHKPLWSNNKRSKHLRFYPGRWRLGTDADISRLPT